MAAGLEAQAPAEAPGADLAQHARLNERRDAGAPEAKRPGGTRRTGAGKHEREKRATDWNGPTGSGSEFFCHAPVCGRCKARELRSIILRRWRMPSRAFKKMRSSGARPAEGLWQQKNEARDLGPIRARLLQLSSSMLALMRMPAALHMRSSLFGDGLRSPRSAL
jgi:hypothetical protein